MPIGFRCTGCRSRLHVPRRWSGNTLTCPKCKTRVVVPVEAATEGSAGPFEGRGVEQSLAVLGHAIPGRRGGVFAEESFELPGNSAGGSAAVEGTRNPQVTLSRIAVYAYVAVVPAVAFASFLLGAWWTARQGR